MGITTVRVKVHNPAMPEKCKEVEVPVDTGAVYTVVKGEILQELGIKPLEKRKFTLANGEKIERDIGGALYMVGERGGHAPIVFGVGGDQPLLGATALEAMGLQVDPISKQLKPTELFLL